ncbi:Lactose permease, partial [Fusarium oxysporum f. sp. albedinis]
YKYRPNPPYPRLLLSSSPPHTTKKGSQRFTKRISSCLEGHISPPGPICQSFLLCVALFFFPFALYLFALFVTL